MLHKFLNVLVIVVLAFGLPSSAFAQDEVPPSIPLEDVSGLAATELFESVVAPELATASGEVQVVVRLKDAPLSLAVGLDAKKVGSRLNAEQQKALKDGLNQKQSDLIAQIEALGGRQIGRLQIVLNAVIVSIDSSQLQAVSKFANVSSIRPVQNYEIDLAETVPYIGSTSVQELGFDGTGVRVAVLDSGIDYLHYNLGGSGDVAEYLANDPTIIEPGTFPTAKVVGGYDFVGNQWPTFGGLMPDEDPLDDGPAGGHGTHVADIIAGKSADGLHEGVAPGASLYAVKVCSSVSTSCSGVALLQGMEYVLDPNGDGNIDDAVDVVNMSLGSAYGQIEDDLSLASANAVKMGVVVVASAGNNADRPYITGSPASTPEVISVAQTAVPSAVTYPLVINAPASIAGVYPNTATLDWAPVGDGFTGDVVYMGRGCTGDPVLADPTGKIALIDRGACNISEKSRIAGENGAIAMLLGLIAPGDAVSFSSGGDLNVVPSLVIIQSYANLIKSTLNSGQVVNASVSPEVVTQLVGSIVGSSSRGPSYTYSQIKPDIGAPGGSLSAEYGTGMGETAFSGTSGAAPMVSGAVALIIQAGPDFKPSDVKALLMNTGETTIYTNPATMPGVLAPITRIGGGEVRVDRAFATRTIAKNGTDGSGALSFGYKSILSNGPTTFKTTILLRNYIAQKRTYTLTPTFRYADDEASGAVKLIVPTTVTVGPKKMVVVPVSLVVDPSKLPLWNLNGGSQGGNGPLLQGVEFDGYLNISDGTDNIHMAWHILPHRSADVSVKSNYFRTDAQGLGSATLYNTFGSVDGRVDVFALLGYSQMVPAAELPKPGDNFAVIDLKLVGARLVGIGGGEYGIQFAINTYGARTHPAYPAEFDIYIDSNRDGLDDYVLYTIEATGFGATGQTLVYVYDLAAGTQAAYFYASADLQSNNMIMTAPLSAIGLTPETQFDFSVYAFDNYFTGNLTDAIEGMTFTAGLPRYFGYGVPATGVPAGGSSVLNIETIEGGDTASPSQIGLLLMYQDGLIGRQADVLLYKAK